MAGILKVDKIRTPDTDSDSIILSSFKTSAAGVISQPEVPSFHQTKNSTTQAQTISGTTMYVITGLDSSYGNSHSTNNKSYFETEFSLSTKFIGCCPAMLLPVVVEFFENISLWFP